MKQEKLINFLEFYLESEIEENEEFAESEEDMSRELEEAGIDTESSKLKVLEMIAGAKIEAKKERGKKFKEEFYKILKELKSSNHQIEIEAPELAMAFRKYDGSSDIDDVLDDEEKMKLLEYLKKKNP